MITDKIVVLVTTPGVEIARRISQVLLEKKKAACVNIVPFINSLFWWQGKIDSDDESLLVIKTQVVLLDDLIEMVKKYHPYEVPEIIALPVAGGNKDYLNWIDDTLNLKPDSQR